VYLKVTSTNFDNLKQKEVMLTVMTWWSGEKYSIS